MFNVTIATSLRQECVKNQFCESEMRFDRQCKIPDEFLAILESQRRQYQPGRQAKAQQHLDFYQKDMHDIME